jgi:hypothetical protein
VRDEEGWAGDGDESPFLTASTLCALLSGYTFGKSGDAREFGGDSGGDGGGGRLGAVLPKSCGRDSYVGGVGGVGMEGFADPQGQEERCRGLVRQGVGEWGEEGRERREMGGGAEKYLTIGRLCSLLAVTARSRRDGKGEGRRGDVAGEHDNGGEGACGEGIGRVEGGGRGGGGVRHRRRRSLSSEEVEDEMRLWEEGWCSQGEGRDRNQEEERRQREATRFCDVSFTAPEAFPMFPRGGGGGGGGSTSFGDVRVTATEEGEEQEAFPKFPWPRQQSVTQSGVQDSLRLLRLQRSVGERKGRDVRGGERESLRCVCCACTGCEGETGRERLRKGRVRQSLSITVHMHRFFFFL